MLNNSGHWRRKMRGSVACEKRRHAELPGFYIIEFPYGTRLESAAE